MCPRELLGHKRLAGHKKTVSPVELTCVSAAKQLFIEMYVRVACFPVFRFREFIILI